MLKIYGADLSTPANKVRFVANYIGVEYEYIRVKIREGENRKEDFLKINPIGKIPAIDDDGFCLFESNAIARYLCVKHKSALYPEDFKMRALVEQWIDFSTMHIAMAMNRVIFNKVFAQFAGVEKDERSLQDGLNFLHRFLPAVEKQLSKNKFLTGENISLADIVLLSALDPAEIVTYDLSAHVNLVKWRGDLRSKNFYSQCYASYGESIKQMMQGKK